MTNASVRLILSQLAEKNSVFDLHYRIREQLANQYFGINADMEDYPVLAMFTQPSDPNLFDVFSDELENDINDISQRRKTIAGPNGVLVATAKCDRLYLICFEKGFIDSFFCGSELVKLTQGYPRKFGIRVAVGQHINSALLAAEMGRQHMLNADSSACASFNAMNSKTLLEFPPVKVDNEGYIKRTESSLRQEFDDESDKLLEHLQI